jgi:hypothetical protein
MAKGSPHINPGQASFLTPGMHGREVIAPLERNFTVVGDDFSVPPTPDLRVGIDIPTRSNQIDRALGIMGVLAKTLPAVEAKEDKGVEFALRQDYGTQYNEKIATMRETHSLYEGKFNDLFANMWKLDEVLEVFKGEKPEEEIRAEFDQDKLKFRGQFIKTDEHSTEVAKKNRAKQRELLDGQQQRYKERNMGVWPYNPKRNRRIAARLRQEARRKAQTATPKAA